MSKKKLDLTDPRRVLIIAVEPYRGAKILIQNVDNIFQYVVYYKDQFYSQYNCITSDHPFSRMEQQEYAGLSLAQAKATIETLIAQETNEDLSETHEQGKAVLDEMEKVWGDKPES